MKHICKNSNKFCEILYYFFIYAFIGWCLETVYVSLKKGIFVNRGFLWGPVCPIYGFGCLLLIFLLSSLKVKNKLIFAASAIVITTVLEYITGALLEMIFNIKLWDYSKELFNIKGRICLKFSIIWGFGAIIMANIIHPRVQRLIFQIPHQYKNVLALALIMCITVDTASTLVFSNRLNPDFRPDLHQVSTQDAEYAKSNVPIEYINQTEEQLTMAQPDFKEVRPDSIDTGIMNKNRDRKSIQSIELLKKIIPFRNRSKKSSYNHIFKHTYFSYI